MNFNKNDLEILSKTIYGEARGEYSNFGIASLLAVGNTIYNRYKKQFSTSVEKVCKAPWQFSCWNKSDPNYKIINTKIIRSNIYEKCILTAENILNEKWPDITGGCDHYHAFSIKPYWATYQKPKIIIGKHHFYILKHK